MERMKGASCLSWVWKEAEHERSGERNDGSVGDRNPERDRVCRTKLRGTLSFGSRIYVVFGLKVEGMSSPFITPSNELYFECEMVCDNSLVKRKKNLKASYFTVKLDKI